MDEWITKPAFQGDWAKLLPLLQERPAHVNAASEPKGYTPLHQAAWHGANLSVVGELLALGADRGLETRSKHQTPQAIAIEKHADRPDLAYILAPGRRTLAQLMRKVAADSPALFHGYDGNQTLCDRLIECFGSDSCHHANEDVDGRVDAAFIALTGAPLSSARPIACGPDDLFQLEADPAFWRDRFLPLLRERASRAHLIPIEESWAVVTDLFDPAPLQWGLRGDPFLWMEMRHALCHVSIPPDPEALAQTIASAFTALTGMRLEKGLDFFVGRFARGGMSSGYICGELWSEGIIPLVQQRSRWLQETWQR